MVFVPPSWVPELPEVPDTITLEEFMYNDNHGRFPIARSRNSYTCGLTGKTYSAAEVRQRVDYLSRAIGKRLGFTPAEGTEWDRVVALYSLNTIDYIPFTHAVHRLSGIVTPANAQYSALELEHQLSSSGAKALFTCMPLLENALQAAKAVGIPEDCVFLLEVPNTEASSKYATIDKLIEEGKKLPAREPLKWIKGQGGRQTAYLCYSSGTSGLPKATMISHRNVIANVLQATVYEDVVRDAHGIERQNSLGVLPFSHIYGLTLVALTSQYRGDQMVVLPKFDMQHVLATIQRFKLQFLPVVPPMLIGIISNKALVAKYDLSSVRVVFSGAAPLGVEVIEDINKMFPKWKVGQGYGMTEASPVVVMSSEDDLYPGSSGSLLPGFKARIIDAEGNEVTKHDERGELLVQSPSIVLGYLNNEKANAETFIHLADGRWLKTGDEALFRKSPKGNEHLFITDRIKELIKVKGFQVAPAELEGHLLAHPYVSDCTVIPVPDDRAGEVPKAYVVKCDAEINGKSDEEVRKAIEKHVEDHKTRYKWLKGGVEFIDAIPKSPSGKILRRLLKDKERKERKAKGSRL